jgi:hypothetical protein
MSTPESQFNRNINLFTQYLMQSNLIGKRTKGYGQLETQRHENMMTRLKEAFSMELARDPVMQRHRALIYKAKEGGKDVGSLVEAMRKDAMKIAQVSFTTSTQKPWTKETAQAATLLTESALVDMVGQGAMGERQARKIGMVDIPGQALRGREVAVEEKRAGIKAAETFGTTPEQVRTAMIDLVKDTVNFLESEGVKGSDLQKADRALFGSGKVPDPLSPENRGKAFTYLMEIWIKLNKGEALNKNEENFLINVRNTRAIEPTEELGAGMTPGTEPGAVGGLPSPRTGMTPGEEATGQDMINQPQNNL